MNYTNNENSATKRGSIRDFFSSPNQYKPKKTKLQYNKFLFPIMSKMLKQIKPMNNTSVPVDINYSNLKIQKIKHSLNCIKDKINSFNVIYLKIENYRTGTVILERNHFESHQFICEHCSKRGFLKNKLFDELIHFKLLYNDVRLRVFVVGDKLKVYVAVNAEELFPYIPSNYKFSLGNSNIVEPNKKYEDLSKIPFLSPELTLKSVKSEIKVSVSMHEGRWRYLASMVDDIFYSSGLVIHILPGQNYFIYDEQWNLSRQKKNYTVKQSDLERKLQPLRANKKDFFHNKPMFTHFNDNSIILESDNEDEIEDLSHFEDKTFFEYPEFDFSDIKMMNAWNKIKRYYTFQKDFNLNKTLLIHDCQEKKQSINMRILKDLIYIQRVTSNKRDSENGLIVSSVKDLSNNKNFEIEKNQNSFCKSRVVSMSMILFQNNLISFEEYSEALMLITGRNATNLDQEENEDSDSENEDRMIEEL